MHSFKPVMTLEDVQKLLTRHNSTWYRVVYVLQ